MAKATANATKLRPLGDRVVIKPTAREEMTKSGIVLPDTVKEKPQEGTIVAAGPGGCWRTASASRWTSRRATRSSTPSTRGPSSRSMSEELLIVSQKDILAIVED